MATTLTEPVAASDELAYATFGIVKFEETKDGDLYVLGKASDDSVDTDEQIVDSKWMQKAVQDWLSTGANVRVQHNSQRDPAGVGVEAYTENDGSTWVKSLVVEPVAKTLVKKGALRAYSVGIARPKIMRDSVARGGRIVDGELCEISLVDRPANKNCGVTIVKSASDGAAEYVDELFGPDELMKELKTAEGEELDAVINKLQSTAEILTKASVPASSETVSLELPKDVSVSFSPADLAKLLQHRATAEKRVADGEVVEKRKFDASVGGGVDRDKIPGADFAGRNRSFPIVTPGDVSDAAASIGRAGADNYSSDELKHRITSIAHRKGPSFVAELPDSWKDEVDVSKGHPFVNERDDDEDDKAEKKGKKPAFPGAKEPFGAEDSDGKDSDGDGSDVDEKKPKGKKMDEAKPDTTKGEKDCPKCGASFHADSKLRNCEKCGAKLPKADKGDGADVEKKLKSICQKCGAMSHDKHKFCPECGSSKADALPVNKNHDFVCLGCDNKLDKGEKFCPGCGKQNPGYLQMADAKLKAEDGAVIEKKKKKGKPTPGDGVVGPGASGIEPVPSHREPDGMAIEAFEHDAGLPTDPDRAAMKAAERHAAVGAPSDLATLHDHLCSAFDPADVAKCYPVDAIASLSVADWQQKALDAAAAAPIEQAQAMTALWHQAVTLKGADPEIVAELRAEAFKEYKDAHPGPGSFPTPTELNPTGFRRARLEGGHAEYSPAPVGEIHGSVPTDHVSASDFNRDYQTSGRAEQSPSNKNEAIIAPAPLPPGMSRTYYRNAEREAAQAAMKAMHDHIAQTFPDLCPSSGPGKGGEPADGTRPVPLPVGKSEEAPVIDAELVAKAQDLIEQAKAAAEAAGMSDVFVGKSTTAEPVSVEVEPVAPLFDAEMLKSVIAEATAPLVEQISAQQKMLKKQQKKLDDMAEMPDPREAPFKGLAMQPSMANKSASGVPVAARTVAENAEQTQMALMNALKVEALNNPDPAQREAAWNRLYQMTGIRP